MSRTHKKCLVASAVTHGLMVLLVLVVSAFITPTIKIEGPSIEMWDLPDDFKLVDENVVGGGDPKAGAAPPPQPAPPKPKPIAKEPDPVPVAKETPKPVIKPDPNAFKIAEDKKKPAPKPPKPEVQIAQAPIKRVITAAKAATSVDTASDAKAAERLRQEREALANKVLGSLKGQLSEGGTTVGIPGPGGHVYMGYGIYLKSVYEKAWITPTSASSKEPLVEVEVVIARDGRVLSSKIIKKSGNVSLDNSVQSTLNRVRKVRALPEGTTDEKRTFRIDFNLAAKQQF